MANRETRFADGRPEICNDHHNKYYFEILGINQSLTGLDYSLGGILEITNE